MERKMAEQIVAFVNGCVDQLIATLPAVEAGVPPAEFADYKRGVARVIKAFDTEILERISREHPDLVPDEDESEPAMEPNPPPGSPN
jgi:hypothetical protein